MVTQDYLQTRRQKGLQYNYFLSNVISMDNTLLLSTLEAGHIHEVWQQRNET